MACTNIARETVGKQKELPKLDFAIVASPGTARPPHSSNLTGRRMDIFYKWVLPTQQSISTAQRHPRYTKDLCLVCLQTHSKVQQPTSESKSKVDLTAKW